MNKKVLAVVAGLALATTVMYAGGDIEPTIVEEVVEDVVEAVTPEIMEDEGGMGMLSMIALMAVTTVTGLFFVNKESKA